MIRPDQIPDEVVEAVEKVLSRYLVGGYTLDHKESIAGIITAAALNAWPWAETRLEDWHTPPETVLILPLSKEGADE
jgi:hypothetical protein